MICGRCALNLPAGSSHVDPLACIDAMKDALAGATLCRECREPIGEKQLYHPRCLPKAAVRAGASVGTSIAERKILDWLSGLTSGKARKEGDEGEELPKRGGGRRFKP